jgi:hypothetical protein
MRNGGVMRKKLTITIDEDVYAGLYRVVGRRKISKFIESLVRPHVDHAGHDRSIVDMLAMPDASDTAFEPPRLQAELYRKSELP